jgi:hypothetical protein
VDEETRSRPSSRLLPVLLVVLALSAVVVWGFQSVISIIPTPGDLAEALAPEPYQEIGPVVITSIRDMAQLTTVETVQYAIVEKGTDAGWLSWARGDSLRLFAVAKIGAGVDLSRMTVRDFSVDEQGVVEVRLPAAEIVYVAPDNEATQVLERDLGLLTRGDPRLETETRRVADEILVQAALDGGILGRAEANAHTVLTNFLMSLGYRDVIVEFDR